MQLSLSAQVNLRNGQLSPNSLIAGYYSTTFSNLEGNWNRNALAIWCRQRSWNQMPRTQRVAASRTSYMTFAKSFSSSQSKTRSFTTFSPRISPQTNGNQHKPTASVLVKRVAAVSMRVLSRRRPRVRVPSASPEKSPDFIIGAFRFSYCLLGEKVQGPPKPVILPVIVVRVGSSVPSPPH